MSVTSATIEAMCRRHPPRIKPEEKVSSAAEDSRHGPAGPSLCCEDLPEVMIGPGALSRKGIKAPLEAAETWDFCADSSSAEDHSLESYQERQSPEVAVHLQSEPSGPAPPCLLGSEWPSLPEALDDFVDCDTVSLSSWLDVGEPNWACDEETGAVIVCPEENKTPTWAERARLHAERSSKPRGVPIPPFVRVAAQKATLQILTPVAEEDALDELERRRLRPEVSRGTTQRRRKR
ncbi:unnamed protein product [Symbiodinium natans]|uniref:Uncharacterized protein n=1 Tax=Symbiodinium natans TaxID=878477 RepID=A0A812KMS0_9DINO|nr:unnamed protein product [Symbiodinium natans]